MSKIARMMQQATAGAGPKTLDIDDVFSIDLVTGTGSAYTVNNGIDLSGEGGLVWIKARNSTGYNHTLFDTERSGTLFSDAANAASDYSSEIASYNNNGFTTSSSAVYNNGNNVTYAAYTFRKAPKFMDIVTYTGNATAGRTLNHNLGAEPALMLIKNTTGSSANWRVYSKWMNGGTNAAQYSMRINQNNAQGTDSGAFNNTAPTATQFTVGVQATNESGINYVAYLFASNFNDGGFGPNEDQDIIKVFPFHGSETVNLGFEPQFLLAKRYDNTGSWWMFDNMRGMPVSTDQKYFTANTSGAEGNVNALDLTSTGFVSKFGNSSSNFIGIAIRRGQLAEPTSASEVFAIDEKNSTGDNKPPLFRSNFPVDLAMLTDTDGMSEFPQLHPRLTTKYYLRSSNSGPEQSGSNFTHDFNNGFRTDTSFNNDHTRLAYMWKRAPSYFDVVCYEGSGSTQNLNHNLGAVPEMMWVKGRNATVGWSVYHKNMDSSSPENYYMELDSAGGRFSGSSYWNNTAPTSSVFTVNSATGVNSSSYRYIAYLFATLAGVSKVGSYTGNGTSTTVDCGFSNGAKFVIVKQLGSGSWLQFDSTKLGINAGNDSFMQINSSNAVSSAADYIDPHSSGFIAVGDNNNMNTNGQTFMFYAIAA